MRIAERPFPDGISRKARGIIIYSFFIVYLTGVCALILDYKKFCFITQKIDGKICCFLFKYIFQIVD
jgi:hypothetical protein